MSTGFNKNETKAVPGACCRSSSTSLRYSSSVIGSRFFSFRFLNIFRHFFTLFQSRLYVSAPRGRQKSEITKVNNHVTIVSLSFFYIGRKFSTRCMYPLEKRLFSLFFSQLNKVIFFGQIFVGDFDSVFLVNFDLGRFVQNFQCILQSGQPFHSLAQLSLRFPTLMIRTGSVFCDRRHILQHSGE